MAIHIYWDNEEKTIIRADFDAEWTWEDYRQGRQKLLDLIAERKCLTHRIVDMHKTSIVPDSSAMLDAMQTRSNTIHRELAGLTIIVGAPKIIEIFTKSLRRIYGSRTNRKHVTSIEDAYNAIENFDLSET